VNPGDAPALSQALLQLIQDPGLRTTLGQAGKQRVRTTFDVERGIDQLAVLFDLPATDTAGEEKDSIALPSAPRTTCHCDR
jgi:hypothetical protein